MTATKITEGTVSFHVPAAGKPCKTWYKIIGDLTSSVTPLVTLHGGPGAGHEYLSPFTDLHTQYNIPIVYYDQIGCGRSTRLPEKNQDETFWTVDLFIKELDNLVDHLGLRKSGYHVLGQSWGGMLGGVYAARNPAGLRKVILADSPASVPLMMKGVNELVKHLPADVQRDLEECTREGDFDSDKYKDACMVFYKKHLCRVDPFPDDVIASLGNLEEDPTVYGTMLGPSEILATGSLKDWEGYSTADRIKSEVLLINGRYDEVQDLAVTPWFHAIPKVKWLHLEKSSHFGQWEERKRYIKFVGAFLGSEKAMKEVGF
ncbi:prolyl aminopeptidase [Bimuria novae-zelandiae CBS 107.79]|uniref:Prolyl aminopeptidase n=1 Tax=Bimuria novae-zelandiae CBS 107.79 TaxID=1447943 RepID=A0A6A5UV43_9PLEO|nr:prolyl aminopeptidase [Bimuria novae-zelandiae CBS 107.79]